MSKPRRVLVLAGGGAKGAYAFGCLKAFKEAGIEFKAVAGTSVGAINAVLWSSGAFAEGERLWRNLSFSSVYPVRFLDPAAHSRAVIRVLAISFVVIRLIWATFHKWPVPGARTWCAAMAAISASPMLILLLSAPFEPMRATMIVIAYLVFVWLGSSALKRRGDNGQLAFCIGAINILWMSTLFAISDYREIRTFPPWAALSLFLILILSAAGSYYLLYCVFQAFARNDAAILGAAPLRDQIAAIVRDHPLSMSTVVGIAKETAVFDPDDPKWATMDLTGDHGQPSADATWYPDLQRVWCPVYLQIEGKPADVAATWCAASAALPFGIVPSVVPGDHSRCGTVRLLDFVGNDCSGVCP